MKSSLDQMKRFGAASLLSFLTTVSAITGAQAGTKDGGGGNLIMGLTQVSSAKIQESIRDSRADVIRFFNGLILVDENNVFNFGKYGASDDESVRLSRLIEGFTKRIAHIDDFLVATQSLRVVLSSKGCKSPAGQSRHGSYQNGLICIDESALAQNLNRFDYVAQVDALMIHEVAHYFGANEAEAVALQTAALSSALASKLQEGRGSEFSFRENVLRLDTAQSKMYEFSINYPNNTCFAKKNEFADEAFNVLRSLGRFEGLSLLNAWMTMDSVYSPKSRRAFLPTYLKNVVQPFVEKYTSDDPCVRATSDEGSQAARALYDDTSKTYNHEFIIVGEKN